MSHSVKRATELIDLIAKSPRNISSLAEDFGVHRSTIFRELQTLERAGYLRKDAAGNFTLGARLIGLARGGIEDLDLRATAFSHVRTLHRVTGNTIHVAALVGDSIIYVDKVNQESGVGIYSRVGKPVIPYCTGVGKAILAELDVFRRDDILEEVTWTRYTDTTIGSRADLDIHLEQIKRQGWAIDDREFEDLINCIAVPVRDSVGIVGAISLTSIFSFKDIDMLMEYIPALQDTARAISSELS